jgi:hypothetical protein
MQRREVRKVTQRRLDIRGDLHCVAEALPSMDDAMPDGISVAQPLLERVFQLLFIDRGARGRELPLGQCLVVFSEQR